MKPPYRCQILIEVLIYFWGTHSPHIAPIRIFEIFSMNVVEINLQKNREEGIENFSCGLKPT